jgi:hypothetical protein
MRASVRVKEAGVRVGVRGKDRVRVRISGMLRVLGMLSSLTLTLNLRSSLLSSLTLTLTLRSSLLSPGVCIK